MLTETTIRNAKPREKSYKLFDERGLFMLVAPTGGRLWRFRYRYGGKEKLLALGSYPDVPLKRAREKRDDARRLVADGIDPSVQRQTDKAALGNAFEVLAREWLKLQEHSIKGSTFEREKSQLERFVFPVVGDRPIGQLTTPEILAILKKIEARGTRDTAHRVRSTFARVLRYSAQTGRPHNINADDLKGALGRIVKQNFASIKEPEQIGELLRAIDGYQGQPVTQAALKLAPLVFVRPGELRAAEWSEFDLDNAEWRIPASRMKMGGQHIVALSRQSLAILRDIQKVTGDGRFVFPSLLSRARPMSENTINGALRRLGYSGKEMVGHGFRSMASTLLNEQGWNADWIEAQLAHSERGSIRGVYNYAKYLPGRRQMMQAWADYVDGLRAGADVVPFKKAG